MVIRQPSTHAALYAWWRDALADPSTPRHDGHPEAGFYRTQMVKRGPWVPVRIFVDRDLDDAGELARPERLVAEVAGEWRDPRPLWLHLTPISRAEYQALVQTDRGDPTKSINLMRKATGPHERYV